MAQLFTNNAYATTSGAITDSATTINLAGGTGARFPSPTGGDYFLLTLIGRDSNGVENAWEIVKVTARATDALTVVRAQESTSAVAWGSATPCELRATSGLWGRHETHLASGGAAHANAVAGGAAGFMTGTDKTKLDGIDDGASANASDATLLDRANHTGDQLASTISNFAATVRATVLAGFSDAATTVVTATHTVLEALGFLQGQITAHQADGTDAHAASAITFSPAGAITSTTVQAAIAELETEKQPLDATLTALAGVTIAADKFIYGSGADAFTTGDVTAFARTLLDDADATTARATLGLTIGSHVQAYDADLAALAGLTSAANKLPYFSGSGTAALADLSAFGRTLIDDADAATAQATLGLTIGTNVQAFDADLSAIAALAGTSGLLQKTGANTWTLDTSTYLTSSAIGVTVQAYDATLAALAGANWAANSLAIGSGADTVAQVTFAVNTFPARASAGNLVAKAITDFGLSLVDDADATTARATLGLAIGTNVQAYDADLAALAGVTSAADKVPYFTGSGTATVADFSAFARTLVDDADAATARATLGLTIGTNVQAFDADLAALAGLTSAADKLPYFTGAGTAGAADFTSFARTLVDDADAGTARTTLGLGTIATQAIPSAGIVKSSGAALSAATDGTDFLSSATGAKQGAQTIFMPASGMIPRTTNGASAGTVESTTNRVMIKTLDFDAATSEYAQFAVRMPKSWDEGTITAYFLWSNDSGTGNVVWGIQGLARSDDDVIDTAFGTAVTVTDGVTAAGDLMQSAVTGAVTIGGTPAEADLVTFQVYRDAASGSDTFAADARLHAVVVVYNTNAANDA